MSGIDLETRRAVLRLKIGPTTELAKPDHQHTLIKGQIEDFARSHRIGVKVTSLPGKLVLTKTGDLASTVKYGEIDLLEVGQSHLFELPPSYHPSIRSSVTYRTRKTGRVFRCIAEGGFLRVTRMPTTDEERAECPPIVQAVSQTKYGMEKLSEQSSLTFNAPKSEHDRIRLAAVRASVKFGWKISCQSQPDGSIVAFRPDAIDGTQTRTGPGMSTRQTKYDLHRLASQRQIVFDIPRTGQSKLRLAVSNFAARQGWTIRCRIQDDGTMLVYRTDVATAAE